jgi:hypothetical protein
VWVVVGYALGSVLDIRKRTRDWDWDGKLLAWKEKTGLYVHSKENEKKKRRRDSERETIRKRQGRMV